MGCGVYYRQLHTVEDSLSQLKLAGIEEDNPAYQVILKQRGALLAKIGQKFPRDPLELMPTTWVSPESFKAWLDPEVGFIIMGRRYDKAPPVYHVVNASVAAAVIKKEITPELKEHLLTPDEYIGE